MKRADEIMEELGFRKQADDTVKAAFVRNLIKQAYGVNVPVPEKFKPVFPDPAHSTKVCASPAPGVDLKGTMPEGGAMEGASAAPIQLAFNLDFSTDKAG